MSTPLSSAHKVGITATVAGVSFLNTMFSGSLTVALPTIGSSLKISQSSLSWPVSLYSLVFGCALLPAGRAADIFGQRLLFLWGTAIFSIFSLIIAFSPNSTSFIIFAGWLGLGSACNMPAGTGVLGKHFEEGVAKNRAFAALGAGQPTGYLCGLVFGALLESSKLGWRSIFYVQAAISLAFLAAAGVCLPKENTPGISNEEPDEAAFPPSSRHRIDWVGAALSTAGLVLFTFSLADAQAAPSGWKTPYIPALLPVSAILLVVFVAWERRLERNLVIRPADQQQEPFSITELFIHGDVKRQLRLLLAQFDGCPPLLPMKVWRKKYFIAICTIVFFAWAPFNAIPYEVNLYLQTFKKLSPLETAVEFVPMVIAGFICNIVAGWAVGRISGWTLMALSMALSMISPLLLGFIRPQFSYWDMMFFIMALSPIPDISYSVCSLQISKSAGRGEQSGAGAIFNVITRLATALGLALSSVVTTAVSSGYAHSHKVPSASPLAQLVGYRASGFLCLGSFGIALLVSMLGLRGIGIVGKSKDNPAQLGATVRPTPPTDVAPSVELATIKSRTGQGYQ